jgi:hypothetical protein
MVIMERLTLSEVFAVESDVGSSATANEAQREGDAGKRQTRRARAVRALTAGWRHDLTKLAIKTLVACLALPALLIASPVLAEEDPWDRAGTAYANGDFALALAVYEQLAYQGNAEAAQIAGQMLLFGEALYGRQVRQDRPRAAQLLQRAADEGRPVAQFLLSRASGSRAAAAAADTGDYWSEPEPLAAGPSDR